MQARGVYILSFRLRVLRGIIPSFPSAPHENEKNRATNHRQNVRKAVMKQNRPDAPPSP
jgi:hypothetical protein